MMRGWSSIFGMCKRLARSHMGAVYWVRDTRLGISIEPSMASVLAVRNIEVGEKNDKF